VILGAGLDTRAVRKQRPGVKYFEIDDPATLNLKQARYEERSIDVNLTFIPANYVTDGLIELLKQNGFDVARPSYFLWEGRHVPAAGNREASLRRAPNARQLLSPVV
jgi:O-methyltransferase involved in polyketide biosynthesis